MGRFDEYKFHCSSLGKIMTEPRSGPGLSETCKEHLMECYIEEIYGREKDIENKYTRKGNMAEEDSMTLYSRITKQFYVKNQETFSNDFLTGTPDIIHHTSIKDLKTSWDLFTFFANLHKPVNKLYAYQLNGYKAIVPGAMTMQLIYVLVNTPDVLIEQQKNKLYYSMGIIDRDSSPEYLEGCEKIDKNNVFDDIPIEKRYIQFDIPPINIGDCYVRVKECRNFLNSLV